jgi:hypothetical protein
LFARYGNEQFEMTRPGELAAVQYVYQLGGSPTMLFMTDKDDPGATPFIPLGYQDVDTVGWTSIRAPSDPGDVSSVLTALRGLGPRTYLLTTRSQEYYLESAANYPRTWGDDFRARMRQVPQVRVVAENADAVVYTLADVKRADPVLRTGYAAGVRLEKTPWSGVGLALLVPLLVVLLTREIVRIRHGRGAGGRLLPLTVVAAPLLIVFGAVLIERIIVLAILSPLPAAGSVCELAGMEAQSAGEVRWEEFQRPAQWCLLKSPLMGLVQNPG